MTRIVFAVVVAVAIFAGCAGDSDPAPEPEPEYRITAWYQIDGGRWYDAPTDPAAVGYGALVGPPGTWSFGVESNLYFEKIIRSHDGTVVERNKDGVWDLDEGYYVLNARTPGINGVGVDCELHVDPEFGRG